MGITQVESLVGNWEELPSPVSSPSLLVLAPSTAEVVRDTEAGVRLGVTGLGSVRVTVVGVAAHCVQTVTVVVQPS